MNTFTKLLCVAIVTTACANAMDYDPTDLGKQFIAAVKADDCNEVKRLRDSGAPVNYKDENGKNVIWYASWTHCPNCLDVLLRPSALAMQNINDLGEQLIVAAQTSNLEQITELIAAGAPVNYGSKRQYQHTGASDMTALMEAALVGNRPCAKALLAAKARVEHATEYGETVLNYAASFDELINNFGINNEHQSICELLVENLLWTPNAKQKQSMCAFLNCAKKYGTKYGFATGFISAWKTPLLQAVYQKNSSHFLDSLAYQEVAKLPEGHIKLALLAKYNANPNADKGHNE